ncbi:MAG TPA: hypothetical protein VNW97_14115 [Candidatus Saccharimonadales bacterium]|jgi:hypothetical protein|nr:hypothetical protein [Candidatus Saccharimonadales bacterium]
MRKARLHRSTVRPPKPIFNSRWPLKAADATRFPPASASSTTCSSLFARHGGFDLKLKAKGDLDVDQHHTVEDAGIALGEAFHSALGDKRGILRAGYFLMPMDETLGLAAVNFSGRTAAVINTRVTARQVGDLQAELVYDFFEGFTGGEGQRPPARALRTLEPSQDRGSVLLPPRN